MLWPIWGLRYAILDWNLQVRHKWVGPCFSYRFYWNCVEYDAQAVQRTLAAQVTALLAELDALRPDHDCDITDWADWGQCSESCGAGTQVRRRWVIEPGTGAGTPCPAADALVEERACEDLTGCIGNCEVGDFSAWSSCSMSCGPGIRFRNRSITQHPGGGGTPCPALVEREDCALAACVDQCVPEFGDTRTLAVIANAEHGLSGPRGFDFHPAPGTQLGESSEGRSFVTDGQEIWAVNGYQHDVTIITGVESAAGHPVATLNRADRGYYHYMTNVTGISFNKVSGSGRRANRDTFGYFATCQDSENTYNGLKQPNFFMGPSLYDSRPAYKNLVGQDGGPCVDGDKCFWLHADMLHESPDCAGIVHDPEILTAYGTVYWAIDGWNGELVRYDFQQPHGPGLMEHSAASVRRYPDVQITRGAPGVISGMVLDDSRRTLYLSDVGSGRIIAVKIDTGVEARDARTEYTIFSSMMPQFEYTVWECAETSDLETTFSTPAGIALTDDSSRLFVAEHYTNMIYALELPSGRKIAEIDLLVPGGGLSALAISPHSGALYFSNQNANEIVRIEPQACSTPVVPIATPGFDWATANMALPPGPTCTVNNTLPELALFQQVHGDSGYADSDQSVQNGSMWAGAALLADRVDCEVDSDLNNDALLLGGYYCHHCLPDPCVEHGGTCANIWWKGYTCTNKRYLELDIQGAFTLSPAASAIANGVDHPVPEIAADLSLAAGPYHIVVNATGHQIYVAAQCGEAGADAARSTGGLVDGHGMLSFTVDANASSLLRYCSVAGSLDLAITLDDSPTALCSNQPELSFCWGVRKHWGQD